MRIVLSTCNLARVERAVILAALAEMGDIEGAAELCGVTWTRFQHLLALHAIAWPGATTTPTPASRVRRLRRPR